MVSDMGEIEMGILVPLDEKPETEKEASPLDDGVGFPEHGYELPSDEDGSDDGTPSRDGLPELGGLTPSAGRARDWRDLAAGWVSVGAPTRAGAWGRKPRRRPRRRPRPSASRPRWQSADHETEDARQAERRAEQIAERRMARSAVRRLRRESERRRDRKFQVMADERAADKWRYIREPDMPEEYVSRIGGTQAYMCAAYLEWLEQQFDVSDTDYDDHDDGYWSYDSE